MASHKHDDSVSVVGILGSGVIGASWASLFLARGLQVDLFDAAPDVAATTNAFIRRAWPQLRELDLVETGLDIEDALARLTICDTAAAAVHRARFVQESVPERMPVKHAIYAEIEPVLRPDAVVSTSSSGLLLGDMQQGWKDPSRFILGHPFNPPHLIPLVELLGNEKTSDGVLEFAAAFYERCGKETILWLKGLPALVMSTRRCGQALGCAGLSWGRICCSALAVAVLALTASAHDMVTVFTPGGIRLAARG